MPFSTSDTIVAIATPPGRGALGIVRLSGPGAGAIAASLTARRRPLEPRRATLATIAGIDEVVATYYPGPRSYTGDDLVEFGAHGSPVVLNGIVAAAVAAGARLAAPGEFTLRAFVNGRIDLPRAEAVADLVDAATPRQARAAFDQLQGTLTTAIAGIEAVLFDLVARLEASVDFPDEGYHFIEAGTLASAIADVRERTARLLADGQRGRLLREGLQIAIVGKPNVGKSTLFNALAGAARAIVTEIPGTTRDLVTETIDLDGLRATLVDTAGLRPAADRIEAEGVSRARGALAVADAVVVVLDGSAALDGNDRDVLAETAARRRVLAVNKADLGCTLEEEWLREAVVLSAATGQGIDGLTRRLLEALDVEPGSDVPAITNLRHIALVRHAHEALGRALGAATMEGGALPEEFVLADLRMAREALEEVTGRRTSDDVLAHIFERFCIGK